MKRTRDQGETPTTCGAKSRAGTPCKRAPTPGKKRCKFHGGRSTGPKTPKGKAAMVQAKVQHGAYATSDAYEAILASQHPDAYAAADAATNVTRELRFARARLAVVARDGAPVTATAELLTEIRLLATAEKELNPGSGLGGKKFEFTVKVVGAELAAAPAKPTPSSSEGA